MPDDRELRFITFRVGPETFVLDIMAVRQIIPYGGSRYRQTTRIRLARGASLIWWELISPGREASGEAFRYDELASHLEISCAGEPLIEEIWKLTPALHALDSAARLGPFPYFASLYLCQAVAARFEPDAAAHTGPRKVGSRSRRLLVSKTVFFRPLL